MAGLFRLGVSRAAGKATGRDATRVRASVFGVAVVVAVLIAVTGVAVGTVTATTVAGDGVEYWIVPENGDLRSVAVPVGKAHLGEVHTAADRLTAIDGVRDATPVLLAIEPVSTADGTTQVLLVGVVAPSRPTTIAGLPTESLRDGDPHYANGSYNGPWTGEAIVSAAAASDLGVHTGDSVTIVSGTDASAGSRDSPGDSFTVTRVAAGSDGALDSVPVVLVHLSELQSTLGVARHDAADQILVDTNRRGVRDEIAAVYPETTVIARQGLATRALADSDLPLALALASLALTLVIGSLLLATAMSLDVVADARLRATLSAIGFSRRARATVVVGEIATVAVLGGLLGTVGGAGCVALLNAAIERFVGVPDLAVFPLVFVPYGLGVAVCIGVVGGLAPVVLSLRSEPGGALGA